MTPHAVAIRIESPEKSMGAEKNQTTLCVGQEAFFCVNLQSGPFGKLRLGDHFPVLPTGAFPFLAAFLLWSISMLRNPAWFHLKYFFALASLVDLWLILGVWKGMVFGETSHLSLLPYFLLLAPVKAGQKGMLRAQDKKWC